MKKLLAVLLICAFCMSMFMLTSCASKEADAPEQEATNAATEKEEKVEEKPVCKIGVDFNISDEYTHTLAAQYEAWAKERGVEVTILYSNMDSAQQMSNVETLMLQGCNVIALRTVDPDAAVSLVEKIKDAGVYCVIDSTRVNTDKYDARISEDARVYGYPTGEYLKAYAAEHPDKKLVMGYINGGVLETLKDRERGIYEIYPQSEMFETVASLSGDWAMDKAMAITEDWLQAYPEMNVIACANDDMTCGVIEALKNAGVDLDEFLVCGASLTANGVSRIQDGSMRCSTYEDFSEHGRIVIDLCISLVNGEEVEKDMGVSITRSVTAENLEDAMKAMNMSE